MQPRGDRRPALFVRWRPSAATMRGSVVLVHGYGEHSGRYEHVMAALAERGFGCLAVDYRGWGQAEGRRAFVRRFDEYLDDVGWAVEECQRRSGHEPVLLGHSQGGLICALLAAERAPNLRGLVLSNPAVEFAVPVPRWKRMAAAAAAAVWPTFSLPAGIDPKLTTRDDGVLASLRADPLMVRRATAAWYRESQRAQARLLAAAPNLTQPSLYLIAGDDRIVHHRATRAVFDQARSPDKTWLEYPGAFHKLFNETAETRDQALRDLAAWLETRSTAPK